MRTGTDVNLWVCRADGYPEVEHRGATLDVDKVYSVTISNPAAWTDNGRLRSGRRAYDLDAFISYRDLWEAFERGGDSIKSFCDFDNCPYPTPDQQPSFGEMASLVGTVFAFSGPP